ncbi:MAG: TetR/AcrR family transcriptional regulator [Candidatus Actinomarinales bacterium]|nr:MAG: TetR/AcrR family transcriptional regulator [Candidatus Actinomarinales bacterium]|tara:strand:- start:1143 stop:1784 length:642 start_codon:yes stop_codon:yes gene_type:complete
MKDEKKIDGRSVRQKTIYDDSQLKLINSAIKLLQDPDLDQKKINVSMIAKNAGTSVATAYNHFPNNMVDVYGAIFNSAFQEVERDLGEYFKTVEDPKLRIKKFIELQAKAIIKLGAAARYMFFNINEIVSSGNWISNEPFDVLLNLCNDYIKEYQSIDAKKLALNTIRNFNGCLFMWMRYNSESSFWSSFTDEWFLNETSLALKQGLAVQGNQ